jgi:hypothetical protein
MPRPVAVESQLVAVVLQPLAVASELVTVAPQPVLAVLMLVPALVLGERMAQLRA